MKGYSKSETAFPNQMEILRKNLRSTCEARVLSDLVLEILICVDFEERETRPWIVDCVAAGQF